MILLKIIYYIVGIIPMAHEFLILVEIKMLHPKLLAYEEGRLKRGGAEKLYAFLMFLYVAWLVVGISFSTTNRAVFCGILLLLVFPTAIKSIEYRILRSCLILGSLIYVTLSEIIC